MESSRERKLRAIERWRSRGEQKDEKSDDCDDGSGFEVSSKKVKEKKMHEIDSENDVTLRKRHVKTKQWRSQMTPEANTAYESNE
jgi:hypothetical protein